MTQTRYDDTEEFPSDDFSFLEFSVLFQQEVDSVVQDLQSDEIDMQTIGDETMYTSTDSPPQNKVEEQAVPPQGNLKNRFASRRAELQDQTAFEGKSSHSLAASTTSYPGIYDDNDSYLSEDDEDLQSIVSALTMATFQSSPYHQQYATFRSRMSNSHKMEGENDVPPLVPCLEDEDTTSRSEDAPVTPQFENARNKEQPVRQSAAENNSSSAGNCFSYGSDKLTDEERNVIVNLFQEAKDVKKENGKKGGLWKKLVLFAANLKIKSGKGGGSSSGGSTVPDEKDYTQERCGRQHQQQWQREAEKAFFPTSDWPVQHIRIVGNEAEC